VAIAGQAKTVPAPPASTNISCEYCSSPQSARIALTMADATNQRRNGALWAGCLLTLLAVLSNGFYFLGLPGQAVLPWVSILLGAVAVACLVVGVKRAFASPQVYRGKIFGSTFAVVSLLLFGLSVWGSFHARDMPSPAGAPQVGQKAPDFVLSDTNGKPVALAQLLSGYGQDSAATAPPKAVLLIFYRGYW
jgi:hypothetical protein